MDEWDRILQEIGACSMAYPYNGPGEEVYGMIAVVAPEVSHV